MKSIFNFRPLFVIFLACILGVTYYIALTTLQNAWLGIFVVLTIFVVFMVLYIIFGGLNLKGKIFNYLHKTYKVWLLFFISMFVFATIFSLNIKVNEKKIVDIKQEVTYVGKIASVKHTDSMYTLELRNVKYVINNETLKLNSNLTLRVYSVAEIENFSVGNIITTTGVITKSEIKSYAYYNYSSLYSARASVSNLTIRKANPSIIESLKLKANSLLTKYMGEENGNIAFAMIFGDKEGVDKEITNVFSIAGISHILAVSGLHIGVLVSVILFILKKCKCKNIATILTLSAILFVYMVICNFTASVVRASIMAIVLTLSHIIGKRYDSLSSLSLAGLLILLFKPTQILSVGFQLSFSCVFAIITIAPYITKMLQKLKFNKKFASALSISTATSIALVPFCAYYFNKVSLFSVLTNIFVVPLFSVVYIMIFPITIIGLVLNFVGYLLVIPNVIIHFIKLIANAVANLKYSYLVVFDVSIFTFVSILAFQYVVHFMVGVPKLKIVLASLLFAVFIVSFVFDCIPKVYNINEMLCFKQYYSNMVVMLNKNGENTLIGYDDKDFYNLNNLTTQKRITSFTNLILYEEIADTSAVNEIIESYKIKNVYISNYQYNEKIKNAKTINGSNIFNIGSAKYNFVIINDEVVGVNYNINDKNNLIANSLTKQKAIQISNNYDYNFNVICVNELTFDIDLIFDYNLLVTQYETNGSTSIKLDQINNFEYDFYEVKYEICTT